ncbi:MAG: hypothetical protein ABJG75_00610 [Roseobacter sp.]
MPFSLVTSSGPVILKTETELHYNFNLYLKACEAMRLDDIIRTPIGLEKCDDNIWLGTYETDLLTHGVRAVAPYTSSALMRMEQGSFRMISVLNARGHHDWTGKQPAAFH